MKDFKLKINLLPKGAWNNDLSKTLSKKYWDTLREFCYKKANGTCQICGAKTNELNAHEVWNFDILSKTQTLKDIIAICTKCHGVIHFKNSSRLGFAQSAKQHFMSVNNATELDFANHLTKAIINYEELNKIYRWKMIADLDKFGGKNIMVQQNNLPLINSPYNSVDWNNYDLIKQEFNNLFFINTKTLYFSEPSVLSIRLDNYQGNITITCENTDRIEWYLDGKKIKTKYNVVGRFITKFNVKDLAGKQLQFKLIGIGGETTSKIFELLPLEVI